MIEKAWHSRLDEADVTGTTSAVAASALALVIVAILRMIGCMTSPRSLRKRSLLLRETQPRAATPERAERLNLLVPQRIRPRVTEEAADPTITYVLNDGTTKTESSSPKTQVQGR